MAAKLPKLPTSTNWRGKARSLETPIAKGRSAALPGQVSCSSYHGEKEITWGEHFQKTVGNSWAKSSHAGIWETSSQEPMETTTSTCWSANTTRLERGSYQETTRLNLDKFTTELQGRQSTKMPFRMFVTVDYVATVRINRTGKRQPNRSNFSCFKKEGSLLFGNNSCPHYPTPRPSSISNATPSSK